MLIPGIVDEQVEMVDDLQRAGRQPACVSSGTLSQIRRNPPRGDADLPDPGDRHIDRVWIAPGNDDVRSFAGEPLGHRLGQGHGCSP